MDRYQKVEKPREDTQVGENEVRITAQGRIRNYVTYAMSLLEGHASSEIVLKAMGRAINKTVMIAELIKRRIVGLHQNTHVYSTDITDTWEPLEEGLLPLETTRHVSTISITLSKKELDTSSPGYQSPAPVDQVKPSPEYEHDEGMDDHAPAGRGRGRGRGGRGRGGARVASNAYVDYNDDRGDDGYNYSGRGRGWGRGRGFRGRGRGYNAGYNGGYNGGDYDSGYGNARYDAPPRGRGRSRGVPRGRGLRGGDRGY